MRGKGKRGGGERENRNPPPSTNKRKFLNYLIFISEGNNMNLFFIGDLLSPECQIVEGDRCDVTLQEA